MMLANPLSSRFTTVRAIPFVTVVRTALIAALVAAALTPLSPVAGQDPQPGDQPERLLLRELDTVGELRTESSRRELTLDFALPNGARLVVDKTERQIDLLTMSVDRQRRATGIRLTINRLRREHHDSGTGQTTQEVDKSEGTSVALMDAGAVAEWRGPNGFPLPAHAVATGDTWTVDGARALAHFGDHGIYDEASATFTVTSLARRGDQLVAEISRVLDRTGRSVDGSSVRERDEGTLSFDVTKGRPLAIRTRSVVEVVQGGLKGTGTRVTTTSWTYRQMELFRILPRAQEGVTQREHAESVTELVIGAANLETGAQAVIHRHIEKLGVTHRSVKKVDAEGRPLVMVLGVPTAWQHTVVGDTKPGSQPERTTMVGPLHGLTGIQLTRATGSDPLQAVAGSLAAAVDKRQADPETAQLFRQNVAEQLQAANAALAARLQPLDEVPGLPSEPVPAGYTWSLPDELALGAFADLLEGITVRRVSAEAQFVDVRQWGGRPRVATLATRLDLHGQSPDGLILEATMPSVTYFDLDEGRPLAMTGSGRIVMRLRTNSRRIEGRGNVRAHTRYYYDRGPGAEVPADDARRRVAGDWQHEDAANGTKQTLRLRLDGTLEFIHPDLQGKPVTESGHWRLLSAASDTDPRLRLVVTIGARNRDVYALRITANRLELERVDDTRHRTGIVPLLLGRTASWRK